MWFDLVISKVASSSDFNAWCSFVNYLLQKQNETKQNKPFLSQPWGEAFALHGGVCTMRGHVGLPPNAYLCYYFFST